MWRRDLAGQRCLFIGADDTTVAALKNCFGWVETGRFNGLNDVNTLAVKSNNNESPPAQVIAVCVYSTMDQAPTVRPCPDQEFQADLSTTVQAAISAMMASDRAAPPPTVLYFVRDSAHTIQTLVGAIKTGAKAYFTFKDSTGIDTDCGLELKLIYHARGVVLNHQLAVSTVLLAQNLTPFQTRVLHCLRDDILTDRAIAAKLGTSEKMVSKTISQLFEIFTCNRRSALAKQSIHI